MRASLSQSLYNVLVCVSATRRRANRIRKNCWPKSFQVSHSTTLALGLNEGGQPFRMIWMSNWPLTFRVSSKNLLFFYSRCIILTTIGTPCTGGVSRSGYKYRPVSSSSVMSTLYHTSWDIGSAVISLIIPIYPRGCRFPKLTNINVKVDPFEIRSRWPVSRPLQGLQTRKLLRYNRKL